MPLWLLGLGGFLKRVPWQVWLAIGLALALWQGAAWHTRKIERLLTHADHAGYARAMGEVKEAQARATATALAAKASAERNQAAITEEVQSGHAQAVSTIRDHATALRLRAGTAGPDSDRTSRSGVPRLPAPSGRTDENAAGRLSRAVGLSYAQQVAALEQCDLNTAQLAALQKWVLDQQSAFPKGEPTPPASGGKALVPTGR